MFPMRFPIKRLTMTERGILCVRLREREIAALNAAARQSGCAIFYDDDVPGSAVRLRAGGSGSWVYQYRIGARQRRLTFGAIGTITAQKAREQAIKLYAAVKLGRDPAGEKNTRQGPRERALPLAKVTRRDIASVLTGIATVKSGATANRIRATSVRFLCLGDPRRSAGFESSARTERREEVLRSRAPTDAELAGTWTALKDDTYGAIVKLLLLTGARREEIGAFEIWVTSKFGEPYRR